jgi:hypothetical protein
VRTYRFAVPRAGVHRSPDIGALAIGSRVAAIRARPSSGSQFSFVRHSIKSAARLFDVPGARPRILQIVFLLVEPSVGHGSTRAGCEEAPARRGAGRDR